MKKKSVVGMLFVALTVTVMNGCGKQEEPVETVIFDTKVSLESGVETTAEVGEAITQAESETEVNEVATQTEEKYIYRQMENPSWDYYHENGTQEMSQQTVFLEKLDETANGISDVNQWISANELDFKPMPYSDENYSYDTYGYNAFVLHYSVSSNSDKIFPSQLIQASMAMKHIKDHAEEYNIDPGKVFVTGFSAGGHLTASLGIMWNKKEIYDAIDMPYGYNKPTGIMPIYPNGPHGMALGNRITECGKAKWVDDCFAAWVKNAVKWAEKFGV